MFPSLILAARVAGLAAKTAVLGRQVNAQKRIAFILTNAPGKAARIGNAVGLDTPASLIKMFEAMQDRAITWPTCLTMAMP